MAAVPAFGLMELLLVVLFGTGVGIPLGIPPGEFDPRLAQVAPDECLFYSAWAGVAEPDAATGNQTEQLLAEPEVQYFLSEVETAVKATLRQWAARQGDPRASQLANLAPQLVKTLCVRPTAIFCEKFQPRAGGVDVVAGLMVNLGEQADDVRRDVSALVELIPEVEIKTVDIAGNSFSQLVLDPAAPEITWGIWDQCLLVGVGPGSLEGLIHRATNTSRTAPPWLTNNSEALSVPRPSTFSYLDLAALVEMITEMGGTEASMVIDLLGLANVESLSSASGLDDKAFVSRSQLVTTGEPQGILELLQTDALTPADLSGIPGDASWAMVFRLDVNRWYEHILDRAREIEPQWVYPVELQRGQIEQTLGLRLQEDLLELLGDCWTLHTSPRSGGLLTGWTATVSLRDEDRFQDVHNRLLGFAAGIFSSAPDAPRIRTSTFLDQTIYSLDVPSPGFFVVPSWSIAEGRVVLGLLPQSVRAYLNRQKQLGSLAEQPEVAAVLAGPSPPFAITYQDTQSHFELLYPFVQLAANAASKQMRRVGVELDPGILPSVGAVAPHLRPTIRTLSATGHGVEIVNCQTMPAASITASAPVVAAFLLPAVQVRRQVSRRSPSMNRLKQIGLAMHNYHDTFQRFPAAYSVNEEGQPLLSWRVHILPFIERGDLYEQFHLDEPWDSEHNKTLIDQMPDVFRPATGPGKVGMTVYLGNASERGIFTPPKGDGAALKFPKGIGFRDITDGTSNTVAVVEAANASAVEWTKPADFSVDKDDPRRGLRGAWPDGFVAVFCDGAVRFVDDSLDPGMVRAYFTRNGGEQVHAP